MCCVSVARTDEVLREGVAGEKLLFEVHRVDLQVSYTMSFSASSSCEVKVVSSETTVVSLSKHTMYVVTKLARLSVGVFQCQ
jgi:hypothetical protein